MDITTGRAPPSQEPIHNTSKAGQELARPGLPRLRPIASIHSGLSSRLSRRLNTVSTAGRKLSGFLLHHLCTSPKESPRPHEKRRYEVGRRWWKRGRGDWRDRLVERSGADREFCYVLFWTAFCSLRIEAPSFPLFIHLPLPQSWDTNEQLHTLRTSSYLPHRLRLFYGHLSGDNTHLLFSKFSFFQIKQNNPHCNGCPFKALLEFSARGGGSARSFDQPIALPPLVASATSFLLPHLLLDPNRNFQCKIENLIFEKFGAFF